MPQHRDAGEEGELGTHDRKVVQDACAVLQDTATNHTEKAPPGAETRALLRRRDLDGLVERLRANLQKPAAREFIMIPGLDLGLLEELRDDPLRSRMHRMAIAALIALLNRRGWS